MRLTPAFCLQGIVEPKGTANVQVIMQVRHFVQVADMLTSLSHCQQAVGRMHAPHVRMYHASS